MEGHSIHDPVLPLSIEKGDSKNRVMLQSTDYQFLYLVHGILFCKSARGLVEKRADISLVIPPGEGIKIRMSTGSIYYRIFLAPQLFVEYKERHWEQGFFFFFKEKITFFPLSGDRPQVLMRIMEDLLAEIGGQKPGYRELVRIKLSELFITLARIKALEEPPVDISHAARGMKEIIRYLEDHYTSSISLDQVACYAGYSPAYFSRYFKRATGICLFAYINKMRIHKACRLLKQTNKTILEIAYEAGYNNISFFNRYFKRIMNISPLAYRKRL